MDSSNFLKENNKIWILIVVIVLFIIVFIYFYNTNFNQNNTNNTINTENFASSQKPKISLYYTKWCGYSKQILPEWDKFVDHLNSNNLNDTMIVEKIDCEKDKEKCKKINGYPTIILEKKNGQQMTMTNQPRTKEGLIKFIQENK